MERYIASSNSVHLDFMRKFWPGVSKIFIFFMALLAIASIAFTVFVFSVFIWHGLQRPINNTLWKFKRPDAYYMQVVDRNLGREVRWEAYVQDSQPVTVTLIADECSEGSRCSRYIEPDDMTIEYMFQQVEGCERLVNGSDCTIDFDSEFGYPKQIIYYGFVLEIEEFIPCGKTIMDCQ